MGHGSCSDFTKGPPTYLVLPLRAHQDAECNKGMASEAWHPILAAAFPELKEWRLADMLLGFA